MYLRGDRDGIVSKIFKFIVIFLQWFEKKGLYSLVLSCKISQKKDLLGG